MAARVLPCIVALILCAGLMAQARPVAPQPRRWAVAVDLVEALSGAKQSHTAGTNTVIETVGGVRRTAIFQHPPLDVKEPNALIAFEPVKLPTLRQGERLTLRLWTSLSGRLAASMPAGSDGTTFVVRVDGRETLRREVTRAEWQPWTLDLTASAGQLLRLELEMAPRANSAADWAVWGDPRIEIEGRPWAPPVAPRPDRLRLTRLAARPLPDRLVSRADGPTGNALVATLDASLDLDAATRRAEPKAGAAIVPPAPEIVAGEGPDPGNHTFVRILGKHGVARLQFMAYPPTVRGGVDVRCGKRADGRAFIAAAPLADRTVREVRLFDLNGLPVGAVRPATAMVPPFAITVVPGRDRGGDLLVVVGRTEPAGLWIAEAFEAGGKRLGAVTLPDGGPWKLEADGRMVVALGRSGKVVEIDVDARTASVAPRPVPDATWLGPSAFGKLTAALADTELSRVRRLGPDGGIEQNVGAYENLFWVQWYRPWTEGKYVRKSTYAHLRTDLATPALAKPPFGATDASAWAGEGMLKRFPGGGFAGYLTEGPKQWEPCFTHRMPMRAFLPWSSVKDPETGLPRYTMLTRQNRIVEYGEFGNIDFHASTYAYGLPDLDKLYTEPLRAFLRNLARPFRLQPERMAGLEPNHEHEIAVEADGSMGDYNTAMIEGFYGYLAAQYGADAAVMARKLGAPRNGWFDAPRNWERGPWDSYQASNPFYKEWVAYQRCVVYRRVADTYREALLAGFPPEIVKCHQIPDTYAVGNLQAFSDVTSRFTPIDWMLNCGAGYGFTRYGVWYKAPHDALQDAHSSGFDAVCVGEYQALTPSVADAYGQLRYMFENGVVSAHCMLWPEAFDKGFNDSMDAAIKRLVAEEKPRPGITGGVSRVCPVATADGRRFDVAGIGTGPNRTGLLKSLREDGSWEGSVYVVPFHSHVEPAETAQRARLTLEPGASASLIGPLKGLDSGCQVSVTLTARRTARGGSLAFHVLRGGVPLPGLRHAVSLSASARPVRYTLRVPVPIEDVTLSAVAQGGPVDLRGIRVSVEREQSSKVARGVFGGKRHRGGVTFDVVR